MPKKLLGEALTLGALAGLVGGAYKFAEFLIHTRKLWDVGSENAVFVRLIQRVRLDLAETQRLLRSPHISRRLEVQKEKSEWVDRAVKDTVKALAEIGRFTERVTRDTERGKWVGLRNRLRWVLDENEALRHRRLELAACHQTLGAVLAFLAPLEMGAGGQEGQYDQYTDVQYDSYEGEQRFRDGYAAMQPPPQDYSRVETRVEYDAPQRQRVYESERAGYEHPREHERRGGGEDEPYATNRDDGYNHPDSSEPRYRDAPPPQDSSRRYAAEDEGYASNRDDGYNHPGPEEQRYRSSPDARERRYEDEPYSTNRSDGYNHPQEPTQFRHERNAERREYSTGPRPLRYANDRDDIRYGIPRQRWGGDLDQSGFGDVEVVERRFEGPIDEEYERVIRRERREEYVPDPRPMRLRVHASKL